MDCDFIDVRGMDDVKAAVEAAIIRRHNMLFVGPPGIGKTMIARRIPTILPPLSQIELEQLEGIYGHINLDAPSARPFRAPHHTISTAAMIGNQKRPFGEFHLAKFGVLFLDEVHEFHRQTLEALAPLLRPADKRNVIVVASAIPCPCGWQNAEYSHRKCLCGLDQIGRHVTRLEYAQTLLDLRAKIQMPLLTLEQLKAAPVGECSAEIRARIEAAWRLEGQKEMVEHVRMMQDTCDHRWQRRRDGRQCSLCDKLELGVF